MIGLKGQSLKCKNSSSLSGYYGLVSQAYLLTESGAEMTVAMKEYKGIITLLLNVHKVAIGTQSVREVRAGMKKMF